MHTPTQDKALAAPITWALPSDTRESFQSQRDFLWIRDFTLEAMRLYILIIADEKSFKLLPSESESKLHVHQDAFERNIYEHQHV